MSDRLEYKGYKASIRYDEEDDLLIGKLLDIPDSVNFHATSIAELHEVFHNCVENYIDFLKETPKDEELKEM